MAKKDTPEIVTGDCVELEKKVNKMERELNRKITAINKRMGMVESCTNETHEAVDRFAVQLTEYGKQMDAQGESLKRVEQKVFNGFGDRIEGLERTMNDNKADNIAAHRETRESLTGLSKATQGIMKFVAVSLITIFVTLLGILGSVWLHHIEDTKDLQRIEREMSNDSADNQADASR